MAKSRGKEPDVPRLCQALQSARQQLRIYREERRESVRQYVGSHWSEEGSREKVPINLLALYVNIVGRSLIAKNPRVMLSTWDRQQKAMVSAMQEWANKQIEHMRLAQTIQRVVLDALFSIGILKVALATPADAAHVAWSLKAGEPYAERVDLDDFVCDMHARSFEEVGFIGHRYRCPLQVVKDSKIYTKSVTKDLHHEYDSPYNLEGDERISRLGRGTYGDSEEEFEDFIDLWEIYLPRHRLVYTLAEDNLTGAQSEPLRVQRWLGPDQGPIHILSYGTVPGNLMPKAPIMDLVDYHEFANQTLRKLMRQTARQKTVGLVAGGAMEDGSRIQSANDGDIIRSDNPEKFREAPIGGPNQQIMAMFIDSIQRFSYMAGNLDMAGGLSPQSKTLGQDKMLEENASKTIRGLQDDTVTFTARAINALCWFWHHDPFKMMQSSHSLQGLPEINTREGRDVGPRERNRVPFEDLGIDVDPYSMQGSTPQKRAGALMQMVQTIIMPMMQLLQQNGISFDVNAFLQKLAEYQDMPDLPDIITIQEPPPAAGEGQGGGGEAPGMPAQTERKYTRESMPGRTQKGDDMNKMNALMGVNPGGDPETNGAMR